LSSHPSAREQRVVCGTADIVPRAVPPAPTFQEHPAPRASLRTQQRRPDALFRSELDDDAPDDIRLAPAQSQPPGDDRFAERICAKVGVRRALAKRGRSQGKAQSTDGMDEQTAFGF
jgi:hypothetical protein